MASIDRKKRFPLFRNGPITVIPCRGGIMHPACAVRITVVILLAVCAASAAAEPPPVRRYLLSAGANNGGRERVLLRYAVSDAEVFASVLTEMGGVDKSNAVILSNPSSRELLRGLSNLSRQIAENKAAAPDVRNEVFVYYSGHANRSGLKLAHETLSWSVFRNAVNSIGADVRVAILDACGSGAITRTKGGDAYPAFLADASSNMTGYAFLTSSNENQASQECDRLKGGFFTHALLNGMRGAADLTGDGKVTINEVYQYAFNETLRSTQNTTAGAQHPSRDMNLAGTGDIIMTDLRETSAILALAPDIEGRFFIRDERGNLFAELSKAGGRLMELGMPPGRYNVQMEALSQRWAANNVVVAGGQKSTLAMGDMRAMPRSRRTVERGDAGAYGEASLYGVNISWAGLSVATGGGDGLRYLPAAKGPGRAQFGIVNTAGELERTQAGAVNIAGLVGRTQAGVINVAGEAERTQIGMANTARYTGVQIAPLNIASESRRQIGLLNISKQSEKTPIGILSIVGNGIYSVTTYADATGDLKASIRTGTPWFYNLIEYSSIARREYSRQNDEGVLAPIGWGAGTQFGMNGRFTLNLDFVWQSVGNKQMKGTENDSLKSTGIGGEEVPKINISYDAKFQDYFKLRFGTNYTVHPLVAVTGGISLNGIFDSFSEAISHKPAGGIYLDREFRDFRLRAWPGAYAGLTVGKIGAN